jgi:hypothetical protein
MPGWVVLTKQRILQDPFPKLVDETFIKVQGCANRQGAGEPHSAFPGSGLFGLIDRVSLEQRCDGFSDKGTQWVERPGNEHAG